MSEKISHTPGVFFAELDAERPGWAVVKSREGDVVHVVGRCRSHDAPLFANAKAAPHDCDHDGCDGRLTQARELVSREVFERARALVTAITGFRYEDIVAAIGPGPAKRLWDRATELQAVLPPEP